MLSGHPRGERHSRNGQAMVCLQAELVKIPCKSGMTTSGHFADTHGCTVHEHNLANSQNVVAWSETENLYAAHVGLLFSCVPKEFQENLKSNLQQQLQELEQRRHDLMPEHQKAQKRSQIIQSIQDKK